MANLPSKALQVLAENLKRAIADRPRSRKRDGELIDSEKKLALDAEIDQRTVNRIVKMQNEPSIDKLEKLAKALGVQSWQLLVPGLQVKAPPELVREPAESAA
jgi:transcriptional regulator with XRE-family HTH domain